MLELFIYGESKSFASYEYASPDCGLFLSFLPFEEQFNFDPIQTSILVSFDGECFRCAFACPEVAEDFSLSGALLQRFPGDLAGLQSWRCPSVTVTLGSESGLSLTPRFAVY